MSRFVVRRTASMIAVLFAISVLTFLIFTAIPHPELPLAGRFPTAATLAHIRHQWGFDQPVYIRYLLIMKLIFTGQIISYTQQVNVVHQIWVYLPVTISLADRCRDHLAVDGDPVRPAERVAGRSLARSWADRAVDDRGVDAGVLPRGLPVVLHRRQAGMAAPGRLREPRQVPWEWFKHMIMPWFALSVLFIGVYSRVLRSTILDTINDDYVRTAQAKGLSERQVMTRHVLRNSMIPIITLFGLDFAAVIGGGAILTETVFNLHGVGQYAAQSVQALDIPPVLVITMFGAFIVVLIGAVIDVLYAVLDPRIRL